MKSRQIDDELSAFKAVVNKSFEDGFATRITAGVNYSDRTKSKLDAGSFLTLNDYPNRIGVPDEFRVANTSLDFLGLGSIQSWDSAGLLEADFYTLTSEHGTSINRAINTLSVTEKITTAFVQVVGNMSTHQAFLDSLEVKVRLSTMNTYVAR